MKENFLKIMHNQSHRSLLKIKKGVQQFFIKKKFFKIVISFLKILFLKESYLIISNKFIY